MIHEKLGPILFCYRGFWLVDWQKMSCELRFAFAHTPTIDKTLIQRQTHITNEYIAHAAHFVRVLHGPKEHVQILGARVQIECERFAQFDCGVVLRKELLFVHSNVT